MINAVPENVIIEVEAGSILVTATIQAQNQSEVTRIRGELKAKGESELTDELGVKVIGPYDELIIEYL